MLVELTFHTPKPIAAKLRAMKSNLGAIVSTLGSLNGSKTAKTRNRCFIRKGSMYEKTTKVITILICAGLILSLIWPKETMDESKLEREPDVICPVSRRIQKQSVTEVLVKWLIGYIVLVPITLIFFPTALVTGETNNQIRDQFL